MVNYTTKKLFLDTPQEVMYVLETNLQGIWETGTALGFKWAFPVTYYAYLKDCLTARPGDFKLYEEAGYQIALLYTQKNLIGLKRDDDDSIKANFEKAASGLLATIPSDIWIYSGIMHRRDKIWPEIYTKLKTLTSKQQNNWFICKEY